MVKFILFLKKIYVFLLFVVLEIVAVNYYAGSTSYTRARLLTATNSVVGGVYKQFADIGDYFALRRDNRTLLEELSRARTELEHYRELLPESVRIDESDEEYARYIFSSATVINNSITRPENFLTLDKGIRDGVEPNMAVLTTQGTIVGYILDCSANYSVAISVLNTNFRTGGKIKDKDYFGSVYWDGSDHNYLMLSEIPKYAEIAKGDTIVTDFSSRFPSDVVIGTVEEFALNQSSYYDVKVKLATRMSTLNHVLLVRYADIVERMMLEEAASGQ